MNAAMNLPQKRRGLSPEGRKIRERAQGTLHVGGYGGPMFPAERRKKPDFVRDNIERLQEIQAKCKQHSAPSRREPLKATREATVKVDSLARCSKNDGQLVSISRAEELRQKRGLSKSKSNGSLEGNGRMIGSGSTTHSDYYSLSDDHNDIEDNQALSPYGRSQLKQEELSALTAEGESRPGSGLINPIKNAIMQNLRDSKNEENFSRNSIKFPRNKKAQTQQQNQYHPNQQIPDTALSVLPRSSRAQRKAHVSQVINRIKGQKPACEIDYNKYCRELENQHRLLLNPSETLSMYGTTVDGSIAGRNSHRSNGSIRGRSCSTDRDSVLSQRNSSRRQQLSQQQQQPLPRRFSRSTSNLSSVRSQTVKTPLDRPGTNHSAMQNGTDRRRMSNQLEVNPLPSLSRSKSNLESRRRANSIPSQRNTPKNFLDANQPQESRRRANSISSNRSPAKNYLHADNAQETDRLSYASQDLDFYNDNHTRNKQVWGTPRQMHLDDLNVTDATENKEKLNDSSVRNCRHNEHYYNDTHEDNDDFVADNYGDNINGVDGNESGSIYYENNHLDSPRFEDDQQELVNTLRTQNEVENGIIPSSRNGMYYEDNEDLGTHHDLPKVNYDHTEALEDYVGRSIHDGQELSYTYNQDRHSSTPATQQQQQSSEMPAQSSLRRSSSRQQLQQQQQKQLQQLKKKNQEKKEKQKQEMKKKQPRHKLGSMPKYLQEIKLEQARHEAAVAAIDPECPEGHTVLDDAERRNTLHLLKKSQAEVMRDISSLPVANDTLRLKKHREELEEKLNQIEEGLAIFSQPKVYVLNDDED